MFNGENLNTDKLPDLKALIVEKSFELYKLCSDNDIQCVILCEKVISHHHIIHQVNPPNEKAHANFWTMLNGFCINLSFGNWQIVRCFQVPQPSPKIEGEEWKQG